MHCFCFVLFFSLEINIKIIHKEDLLTLSIKVLTTVEMFQVLSLSVIRYELLALEFWQFWANAVISNIPGLINIHEMDFIVKRGLSRTHLVPCDAAFRYNFSARPLSQNGHRSRTQSLSWLPAVSGRGRGSKVTHVRANRGPREESSLCVFW